MPVVIAANGFGIPVIHTPGAFPAVVAENGFGVPIVIVEENGVPMDVSGYEP